MVESPKFESDLSISQALGPHLGQRARHCPLLPGLKVGRKSVGHLATFLLAGAEGGGLVPGLAFHTWALLPPHPPEHSCVCSFFFFLIFLFFYGCVGLSFLGEGFL